MHPLDGWFGLTGFTPHAAVNESPSATYSRPLSGAAAGTAGAAAAVGESRNSAATSSSGRHTMARSYRRRTGTVAMVPRAGAPGQSPAYARSRSLSPSRTDGHSASMTE